jgi:hypothetical protein
MTEMDRTKMAERYSYTEPGCQTRAQRYGLKRLKMYGIVWKG